MSAVRLSPDSLRDYQSALSEAGVDGWLFYDFRGTNPVAGELLGIGGFVTRRIFVWVPARVRRSRSRTRSSRACGADWPAAWRRVVYSSWRSLEQHVRAARRREADRHGVFGGRCGAVPRPDSGRMLELVRASGATVVSSGDLVSRFYATWSADDLATHRRAAQIVAEVARDAIAFAGEQARSGAQPAHEHEVQARIASAFTRAGLRVQSPA